MFSLNTKLLLILLTYFIYEGIELVYIFIENCECLVTPLYRMTMDLKEEGRIERAPLSALIFSMNLISILGNSVVLYIFGTKYDSRSNYRLFVLYLAVLDIGTAIGHVLKEETRIKRMYYGGNNQLCRITIYIGNSIGFA